MTLLLSLLLAVAGCAEISGWQAQINQASQDADADLDGFSQSDGDCEESCETQFRSPDGTTVCYGWYFHPMAAADLERLSLGPALDQDCDGLDDDKQPGLDFDGDGFDGVPVPGDIRDCNDRDSRVRPDAEDVCGDNIDQNCDGKDAPCGEE